MEMTLQLSPIAKSFLAGSLSGTCSTLLFQPLDLVKTRQQSHGLKAPSMARVAHSIIATDTLAGLWRGVLPSICRTVPGVGIYFSSMHWMKSKLGSRPSTLQTLLVGGGARAIAATAMIPFTVIKTRFESPSFSYRSVSSALRSVLQTEGSPGLVRGLAPTLLRDVPFSALYLACYEGLKASCPPALSASSPTSCHLLAGLGAGLLASLLTHPADVVKTRMQLAGPRSSLRVVATVASIYREAGASAFSSGLAPRLLRRTSMALLAWSVYERMLRGLKVK